MPTTRRVSRRFSCCSLTRRWRSPRMAGCATNSAPPESSPATTRTASPLATPICACGTGPSAAMAMAPTTPASRATRSSWTWRSRRHSRSCARATPASRARAPIRNRRATTTASRNWRSAAAFTLRVQAGNGGRCPVAPGSITNGRRACSTGTPPAGTGSASISTMAARSWHSAFAAAMARRAGRRRVGATASAVSAVTPHTR